MEVYRSSSTVRERRVVVITTSPGALAQLAAWLVSIPGRRVVIIETAAPANEDDAK